MLGYAKNHGRMELPWLVWVCPGDMYPWAETEDGLMFPEQWSLQQNQGSDKEWEETSWDGVGKP